MFLGATVKRLFITSFALLLGVLEASQASAQSYSYSQDRIAQGYGSAVTLYDRNHSNEAPAYPAPSSAQSYGFYLHQKPQSSRGQLTWYPTARQRAQGFGMPPYDQAGYAPQGSTSPYRSPVYYQEHSRSRVFYAGANIGLGSTLGWKGVLDHPIVPVWSLTLGKRFDRTLRGDIEFQHHTRAKLSNTKNSEVNYTQYELGANVYYDFPVTTVYRPFIGAGIWGVKAKLSGYQGSRPVDTSSNIKLAFSLATGLSYRFSEAFSLLALLRARYIFSKDDLYNLEGLLGVQYHF